MYLYGKPRRPDMVLLMEARCTRVLPIVLHKDFVELDGWKLVADERDALAWRDGFRPPGSTAAAPGPAFSLMAGFWRSSMLPLSAALNEWDQNHLESVIETHLVPGSNVASDPEDQAIVDAARRSWKRAEDFQLYLAVNGRKRA